MAPKGTPAKSNGMGAPPTPLPQQAPPATPGPPPPPAPPENVLPPLAAAKVAPPKKKSRSTVKMPGAKTGFPTRLAEQLRDYFIIGVVMAGVAMLGNAKLEVAAHGHGHGHEEEHGHEEVHHRALTVVSKYAGRVLNGHADPTLDMQVTLGICVVLITVTIVFEVGKHHMEHNCPPLMQPILQAMFGELTVLGFIALYTYFMLKFGVLEWISLQIYHDPEHLIHLFEDIHFMLFFVMLVFLAEACILIIATLRAEEFFERTEQMLMGAPVLEKASPAEAAAAPAVSQMLATYKAARSNCCNRICICPRMLWGYREAEAKEELTYSLIRSRFVFPPRAEPGKTPLPTDFAFSTYLRHRMVHEVAHCLHVSPATWTCIIVFLSLILYLPVLEHNYAHYDITVHWVVGLGWSLWLYSFAIRAKLGHVMYMLTPPHALLEGPPRAFDEEAPTVALLAQKTEAPPYESLAPTKTGSKQERLFWQGRAGPGHLLFLLRLQMLGTAICLAVLYSWMTTNPADTGVLLLGFLPVLDVMITSPKALLPAMVITTSTEMLKKNGAVKETLDEMRTEKTLKMLKMLQTLQAQAKRAKKLQDMDKKRRPGAPPPKAKELDPTTEAELTQAFQLFDKDNSGSIDKEELGLVMQSLGVELDSTQLATLYVQMDPSGDGVIDFKEFCDVMAEDKSTETPAQIASNIFLMLDKDGSGKIFAKELKESVIIVNPALTDDDIAAAMAIFDSDGSGSISEKEFRQGIEKMKTFG